MNDTLYLFIGKSASGKTTSANLLNEKYGLKQVFSYTTRPKRYKNETGHIFINDTEFDNLNKLIAYTIYNGYRYGATLDQLNECSIYVIDISGLETLLKNWLNYKRPICVIYFEAAVSTRIDRMVNRGDSDIQIISRLHTDDTPDDWYRQLDKIVWKYKNIDFMNVELCKINANADIEDVLQQVLYCINNDEKLE